ncbi:hypothetical protein E2C01_058233 [Portunus trituberculatus]|uniref:Uncharacterized protein n=1 Tax=Portunus trituberculatus TaxID=210409 RepID=A0A5B7GZA3_PORTR|nr:hypothetical protein [Portunus trituberculatus]
MYLNFWYEGKKKKKKSKQVHERVRREKIGPNYYQTGPGQHTGVGPGSGGSD